LIFIQKIIAFWVDMCYFFEVSSKSQDNRKRETPGDDFMNGKIFLILLSGVILTGGVTGRARAMVMINEILTDPPAGLAGDANRDGGRSASHDEFIELFNAGTAPVDLQGWTIADAVLTRHVFSQSYLLEPQGIMVIFGGGSPDLSGAAWQIASSGALSLNNSGDSVRLFDSGAVMADFAEYGPEGGRGQSLTRLAEGDPSSVWVLHGEHPDSGGALYSPGVRADGSSWPANFSENGPQEVTTVPESAGRQEATVPEPSGLMLLGLFGLALARKNISRRPETARRVSFFPRR
jgi:hypothetical protein